MDSSIQVWSSHWLGLTWSCTRATWWCLELGRCTLAERSCRSPLHFPPLWYHLVTQVNEFLFKRCGKNIIQLTSTTQTGKWTTLKTDQMIMPCLNTTKRNIDTWHLTKGPQTTEDWTNDNALPQHYQKVHGQLKTVQMIIPCLNNSNRTTDNWRMDKLMIMPCLNSTKKTIDTWRLRLDKWYHLVTKHYILV